MIHLENLTQTIIKQPHPGADSWNVKVSFTLEMEINITRTGFNSEYLPGCIAELREKLREELKKIV